MQETQPPSSESSDSSGNITLANLRTSIKLLPVTQSWMRSIKKPNVWFVSDGEIVYFNEFGYVVNRKLVETAQLVLDGFFIGLGFSPEQLPRFTIQRSDRGSWVIEAVIELSGPVSMAYLALKELAQTPDFFDGLKEVKKRLKLAFYKAVSEATQQDLKKEAKKLGVDEPPNEPLVEVALDLDDRPARTLLSAEGLNIVYSLSVNNIEQLGDVTRDVRVIRLALERLAGIERSLRIIEQKAESLTPLSTDLEALVHKTLVRWVPLSAVIFAAMIILAIIFWSKGVF